MEVGVDIIRNGGWPLSVTILYQFNFLFYSEQIYFSVFNFVIFKIQTVAKYIAIAKAAVS